MISVFPFKALRPNPQFAKQVASKPYDVLNSAEAKIEVQGNPNSFLYVTKSEVSLPDGIDIHTPEVYEKAADNLQTFIAKNILFKEDKECYYIYQLIMNGHTQTGLVAISSIDDYENGLIKKHEFTRPEKELDRINHIKTTKAQTGNVFLAYRNNETIDSIVENWKTSKSPAYNFIAEDGVDHTIWTVFDSDVIEKIKTTFSQEVPCSYIADGHHRAASAAKVRTALGTDITTESNYFLTTLFPSNQLRIMDYNRLVKDTNGLSEAQLIEKLAINFLVEKIGTKAYKPQVIHEFGMYINKTWYKLTAKEGSYTTDAIGVLDVTILQNNIFSPILNLHDQRTDKRVDFVGGIRGLEALEKRVNSGEMQLAFSLYPVTIEQLFDIADSGNVMPPKSTWFEPKLRDGLLTHLI